MFEKKVTKNQEMRIKYPDNPEKYVECCLGLCVDINVIASTGLLIFRAVAEPQNSGNSSKSHKIHKNTQNATKFGRNRIKYMSVKHF